MAYRLREERESTVIEGRCYMPYFAVLSILAQGGVVVLPLIAGCVAWISRWGWIASFGVAIATIIASLVIAASVRFRLTVRDSGVDLAFRLAGLPLHRKHYGPGVHVVGAFDWDHGELGLELVPKGASAEQERFWLVAWKGETEKLRPVIADALTRHGL